MKQQHSTGDKRRENGLENDDQVAERTSFELNSCFFCFVLDLFFSHQFPSDSQGTRVHTTTRVKEQPVRF